MDINGNVEGVGVWREREGHTTFTHQPLRGQYPQDDHGNRFKLMSCYLTIPSFTLKIKWWETCEYQKNTENNHREIKSGVSHGEVSIMQIREIFILEG